MKQPKEPKTFRYPRIYGAFIADPEFCRLRIIEPDGTSTWFSSYIGIKHLVHPCWYVDGMSGEQAVKAMKAFDREFGHKTLFIGEIR